MIISAFQMFQFLRKGSDLLSGTGTRKLFRAQLDSMR